MNCPSRNDGAVLVHPEWNESPPHLSADLTTCQDFNGRANSRELGHASALNDVHDSPGQQTSEHGSKSEREKIGEAIGEGVKGPHGPGTRSPFVESITTGNVGQDASSVGRSSSAVASMRDWSRWLLSVLATSILISYCANTHFMPLFNGVKPSPHGHQEMSTPSVNVKRHVKRDACASNEVEEYNLSFHVGALFLILFVSASACAFPVLVIRFPRLRIPASFLFSAKHFGTGVLVATAFVHLIPTAFGSLSNPCLSSFWVEDYPAMPGAIVLAAVFFVITVEMIFSRNQHTCGGGDSGINAVVRETESQGNEVAAPVSQGTDRDEITSEHDVQPRNLGPLKGRSRSIGRTLSQMGQENERLANIEYGKADAEPSKEERESSLEQDAERSTKHIRVHLTPEQEHKKAILQCMLLEMGILFHSIFIGMALAVSVGSEFIVLLIAIVFHQTFEGLALGARIAAIKWDRKALQPWFMALAYGCTTPLGQAIGIATHTLYSPDSEVGLLVVGIFNAISSGLLVYASLVELLAEDFLSDESWRVLRGKKRVYACFLVFLGAFLMSLVGAWA